VPNRHFRHFPADLRRCSRSAAIVCINPSDGGPRVRIHLPPAESPMRTSLASSSVSPSWTTTLSTSRSSTERAQISQMIERQAARECCTDRLARLASTTAWRPYPSIRLPRARATQSAAVPTSDRTGNDSRACRDRAYRLDPIDPNDPAWRRSSEKGALWVCALTPGKARILVANKTPEFLEPNPRGTFGTFSPWLHEHLATCVLDTSKGQIPDSTVKRADGSVVRAPF